jgi:uncharacterized protein (TIGR03435 family)
MGGYAKTMATNERCWMGTGAVFAVVAALCVVTGMAALAQDAAKPEPAKTMPKDANPGWEVASVKPSDPNEENQTIRMLGRHMVIQRQTVETMLSAAYGLQKNQIADAPEWVRKESFDVDGVADVEGQPSTQQFQSLIRKLLVERFGLKTHLEQREMAVFALRVAKDGPKLKSASNPGPLVNQQRVEGGIGYRTLQFTSTSMQDLTLMMLQYVDRPVVDQTGLTGQYDFELKYTYDETRAPTDGSAPPSLFTAIQEQIALKLEPVKAPAEVLLIDHVDRPSAN